ncbi:alpha/beta fold hydrolase [Salisediminibacterium selenitireducens]|uniref:Alpha/beta hydrolase fold protein n=1 Tax=Bacillus selenitireducens (strain ATCC 700615 / DSM 15326 / MLS10) TaxID=439292 RepID=D6XWM5_BACIE|nr:alpha/beta hydrolase [Salisediminibacterium selenitireducens]ADH97867.1 alpha/beta hydrolase fold protein [[Bacillus] selenitireducens MLS10]
MDPFEQYYIQIEGREDATHTLVFAHGFGCDQQVWNLVSPAFEDEYLIVRFDYTGAGRSAKSAYSSEKYRTLDGYAEDLKAVIHAAGGERITVVAHSVSGMIAAQAIIDEPGLFDDLIMIGPSAHYLNHPDYHGGFDREDIDGLLHMMEQNYKEWARYLAPIVMKNEDRPELAEDFSNQLCSNDAAIIREFAEATFLSDHRDILEAVNVPVLVIQPADDTIVPVEATTYLVRELPDARIVWMNGRGHNPHLSHPEELIPLIEEWTGRDGVRE